MEILLQTLIFQTELMARILVAIILGVLIGFERKNRNKVAGERTHAIVAMGAALIMVVSKYGFGDVPGHDAARVAAQVVSGVGFLGAGLIFVRNREISGLTTAAGLWTTAGVGLAAGAGLYYIAIGTTLLLLFVQFLLHKIKFIAMEPYQGQLKISISTEGNMIEEIKKRLLEQKIKIINIKINKPEQDEIRLEIAVTYPTDFCKTDFICELYELAGVISIRG